MTVLAQYPSKSKPGQYHEVREGGDGKIYCTCWGWKKNRNCVHLEMFGMKHTVEKYKMPAKPVENFDTLLDEVVERLKAR